MEQKEVVNGLGIYGRTGHKIARLLFKNARQNHYRFWKYSRCDVKPTGDFVVTTSIHPLQERGHWTPRLDELPDLDSVKTVFADLATAALKNYSRGLPSDELLQVYGSTKSIIYQARKGELECFRDKLSGKYADDVLKDVYGEKFFKNVVGSMADPLAVEVRTALAEEIAAVNKRADEEASRLRREADSALAEVFKRYDSEKAAERVRSLKAINEITAKYLPMQRAIERKLEEGKKAVYAKASEEIKKLRRSTR